MNAPVTVPAVPAKRRSPWPWALALGLGLGVGGNLWMVSIALSHRSALEPGDHEHDAVAFDEVIAARRAAASLHWRVDLDRCQPGAAGCTLRLDVTDADGRAVTGLAGTIDARRSDDATLDRSAQLRPRPGGGYEVALPLVRPGFYRLAITLQGGRAPWVGERELLWDPPET